jgi:hypothetical protein
MASRFLLTRFLERLWLYGPEATGRLADSAACAALRWLSIAPFKGATR